jgi:hypothetical protein
MNTVLTELAKKAKVEHCISHVRLQDFAKFIVKETLNQMCIQMLEQGDDQSNNPVFYKAIIATEKHLGVEE